MLNYISGALNNGTFSFFGLLSYLLSTLAVIFITMPIHEWAHGFISTKLGDPTPRYQGRLTLNPMAHIDKRGSLMILLFGIGWAKPVQVNARYYKNPKFGMVLVAFAGPMANVLLSFVAAFLCQLFEFFGIPFLPYVFLYIAYISLCLAVFNMIPIPPFDGSRILFAFLPQKYYFKIMQYERYIFIGLMALFIFDSRIGIISNTIDEIVSELLLLIGNVTILPFRLLGV